MGRYFSIWWNLNTWNSQSFRNFRSMMAQGICFSLSVYVSLSSNFGWNVHSRPFSYDISACSAECGNTLISWKMGLFLQPQGMQCDTINQSPWSHCPVSGTGLGVALWPSTKVGDVNRRGLDRDSGKAFIFPIRRNNKFTRHGSFSLCFSLLGVQTCCLVVPQSSCDCDVTNQMKVVC